MYVGYYPECGGGFCYDDWGPPVDSWGGKSTWKGYGYGKGPSKEMDITSYAKGKWDPGYMKGSYGYAMKGQDNASIKGGHRVADIAPYAKGKMKTDHGGGFGVSLADSGKKGFTQKGNKEIAKGELDCPEKLFVGSLPKSVTADQLREYFLSFGKVQDVDLKVDFNGIPRGFAFVLFESAEAAQQVLHNRDHNMLDGQWIDCKPAMEDKGKIKFKGKGVEEACMSENANTVVTDKLFVNNLPSDTTEESLTFHFGQYAEVKSVALKTHALTGHFRGFAFVTFDSNEAAQLILETPDAAEFEGHKLDMKPAVETGYKGKGKDDCKGMGKKEKGKDDGIRKIWVGCIPLHAVEDEVWRYFGYFGPVEEVMLEYDDMGLPRGCGHVIFVSSSSAKQVLDHYSDVKFDPLEFEPGTLLDIKPSEPGAKIVLRGDRTDTPVTEKIFIGSLPKSLRQEELQAHFAQFGAIKEVFRKCGPDGVFWGHGSVTYKDAASAKKALEGATLGVCKPYAKFEVTKDAAPEPTANVLKVSGLPADSKSRDVFKFFFNYSVTRIRDTGNDIFIEFTSDAQCKKAFKDKQGQKLGSHVATIVGASQEELKRAAEVMQSMDKRGGCGKGGFGPVEGASAGCNFNPY